MPTRKPPPTFFERFGSLIPWMASIILGGIINLVIMYQQFQEVKKNQEETKEELKQQAQRLVEFREKQISELSDIQVLKGNVQNLDNRVLVIERVFVEKMPQYLQVYPQQQQFQAPQPYTGKPK